MLKKINRLSKERDINKVFKFGKLVNSNHLVLKFSATRLKEPRFAFIVGRKVNKKAVRRNFLKRQLRAVVARLIFQVESGYDVVVLVKKDFEFPYNKSEISNELVGTFKKTEIIPNVETDRYKTN